MSVVFAESRFDAKREADLLANREAFDTVVTECPHCLRDRTDRIIMHWCGWVVVLLIGMAAAGWLS